jgi:glucose/arabinose dehydrogenase
MAFLKPNDILVLEKNNGTVQRIVNGVMLRKPLLDVNVATRSERGMLGIAVAPNHENNKPTYVFLYYTESKTKDGEDANLGHAAKEPLGNRLYRYELADNNTRLINPKLLLDIPTGGASLHNGGKLLIGPDNNVYVIVGDNSVADTQASNIQKGILPIERAGILRITQDGKAVHGIFGDKDPLNKYYAYGIRNGFGISFDPVTKRLWDTENGPNFGDEINLVRPGFNSGWIKVAGFWQELKNKTIVNVTGTPKGLVDFNGIGKYSPPEFSWFKPTVGPTAIKFLNSDKLGKQYENDMFVGDIHRGYLYHFDLNKKRTALSLIEPLKDKVSNNRDELENGGIIFGKGFGGITDIQVGPDGYLYVLSLYQGGGNCSVRNDRQGCVAYSSPVAGTIFRIVPTKTATETASSTTITEKQTTTTNNESNSQQQEPVNTDNLTSSSTNSTNNISIVQDAYLMTDKAFSPNPATVKVGDTVTWTNDDDQPHTVTSGTGSDDPNKGKVFDSGPSALETKGKTFQHKFTEAGQYPNFCELHPMMVGKIIASSFK